MPTIKDVAKKAHVSVTTVSRVINKHAYVDEQTRAMVLKVIQELNYAPSEVARGLSNKSSKLIGLIVPHLGTQFYGKLVEGIEEEAIAHGFKIMLCNSQGEKTRENEYLGIFSQYNIEGIILGATTDNAERYNKISVPLVSIDHKINDSIPSVSSDNYDGGRLVAKTFLKSGVKKPAQFRGPSNLLTFVRRAKGFEDEMNKAGLEVKSIDFGLLNPEINEMIDFFKENEIDCLFANTDFIAFHAMNALKSLGIRIPEDVQVIGYDNNDFSALSTPTLSTISQEISFMGKEGTKMLFKMINKKELIEKHKIINVRYIDRNSTK